MWLWIAYIAYAQPVAKITGPVQVPAGELTALSSTGSSGDNLVWITPEGLATIQSGCELMDQQIFFSTTRKGIYEFTLIVADKEARIAYSRHTVAVGETTDPGPPPVNPTPAKWAELQSISKQQADSINDEPTRIALKAALERQLIDIKDKCDKQQCPTLAQAQSNISKTIDTTLLSRENRFSIWSPWRVAIGKPITNKGVKDLPDYLNAVKSFAAGL